MRASGLPERAAVFVTAMPCPSSGNTTRRALCGAGLLVAFAWFSLVAPATGATAGCPPAPTLAAKTYDAAVAELKSKRSTVVPRREATPSARPAGTLLAPPKPSIEQGICVLTFTVSDGSLAKVAVTKIDRTGIARSRTGGGTADGPATPPTPTAPATTTPAPTPPAAQTPPTAQPPATSTARQDAAQAFGDALSKIFQQPPPTRGGDKRPPPVDDVRGAPPSRSATPCPALPEFRPRTFEAAVAALQPRGVRVQRVDRPSSLPRGALLEQPTQQRDGRGVCTVTLVASDGSLVRVPAIVGMHRDQAHDIVVAADLRFESEEATSDSSPGSVLRQNPRAGLEVARGTVVRTAVARVPDLVVPAVIGLQEDVARQRLAGFRVERTVEEGERPAGEVVRQEPTAGQRRPRGAAVRFAVSDGSLVRIPALTGLSLDSARGRLQAAGFSLSTAERDDPAALQSVVEQVPTAGTVAKRGSRVAVVVSAGLAVPSVVDMPLDAARTTLARFKVEPVTTESAAELNRVLEQDPAAGARVAGDVTIRLRVSDASLVPVPDVRNLTLADARSALAGAGLVAQLSDGRYEADAQVTEQRPLAGAVVRRNSAVSLTVRASFPWARVLGAVALLLGGAAAYRLIRPPPQPIVVDAKVEFQPAPPQPDDADRTGPDISIDARVVPGETKVELEEKVPA